MSAQRPSTRLLRSLTRSLQAQLSECARLPPLSAQHAHTGTALRTFVAASGPTDIRWTFLGPPGVGKGTYADIIAKRLGVAHVATGDLIRHEIKTGTPLGLQMKGIVEAGKLVPDELIFQLLEQRLAEGKDKGEKGFILDGFPRTRPQAEALLSRIHIQLALNMNLREDVLVEKCLGRRLCKHCGKNYNIANIRRPATDGHPAILMPPLSPPPECAPHLETRADDTEEVVRARLKVYHEQCDPVEEVFRQAGVLTEFEITGGIPETLPTLIDTLTPHIPKP